MKKPLFWLILLGFALAISLVVGEVGLRVYHQAMVVTAPPTHNLPECLALPNGYFNYDLEPNTTVVYDSKNPRTFSINEWGFQSPDYNQIKTTRCEANFLLGRIFNI